MEDYSALISACIKLHQATLDLDWLRRACELAEEMIELFWDKDKNEFYDLFLLFVLFEQFLDNVNLFPIFQ